MKIIFVFTLSVLTIGLEAIDLTGKVQNYLHDVLDEMAQTETELGSETKNIGAMLGGALAGAANAVAPGAAAGRAATAPSKSGMAPINVIDNSRGSSFPGGNFGGGGGMGMGMMPPQMMMGGYNMGTGGGGFYGGLGNLGIPDSEYLTPVLQQRIDFLQRQINKIKGIPEGGATSAAPSAGAAAAPAEEAEAAAPDE